MYQNVIFTGVGTYHPSNEVDNSFFIDYYNNKGIDVESLLQALGREKRFLDDSGEENVITMSYNAGKVALEKAKSKPEEIDLIIFATDSPEYIAPSNAVILSGKLGTVNAHLCFDINTNCTGLLTAFTVANSIMAQNERINKALIVGSLLSSTVVSKLEPSLYSTMGDSAAALVLEKKVEKTKRGFIDSQTKTSPFDKQTFVFPKTGLSKAYDPDIDIEEKKLRLVPFDASFIPMEWVKLIDTMLERNDYKIDDINHFFFSQFSRQYLADMSEHYGLTEQKLTFVAERYGYTGVSSPFMALHDTLEDGRITEGDNIILCSVGAGYNISAIMYKL